MVNHGSKCYMEKSIQVMQLKQCTCLKKVLIPYCPLPACLGPEPLLHPVYPGYMAPTVWHLVPTSVIKSTTEYLQCWQEYSKGVYNIHIFLVNEGSSYNDTLQVGFKLLLFKCKTLLLNTHLGTELKTSSLLDRRYDVGCWRRKVIRGLTQLWTP